MLLQWQGLPSEMTRSHFHRAATSRFKLAPSMMMDQYFRLCRA
uniref:Uncharacterized protein n=1 Tax=Anguilla anguilla TaxID=7936 RepID=A0A0E9W165_ANGAN